MVIPVDPGWADARTGAVPKEFAGARSVADSVRPPCTVHVKQVGRDRPLVGTSGRGADQGVG